MKLNKIIDELNSLQDCVDHPIGKEKIDEIIGSLKYIEPIIELFDSKFGKASFYIEKINNIPWLFFGEHQLLMLTEKQAKNINKVIKEN